LKPGQKCCTDLLRFRHAYGAIFKHGFKTLRDAIEDLEESASTDIDHIPRQETGIRLERILALKPGQTMKDLPSELQHNSFKRRANRRVSDGTPSEKRGGAPSGLKRLIYDEPSLTITSTSTSEFLHPSKNRVLTVRECARIQTFPDKFVFCGTEQQKMLQIGNAIPPLLADSLIKQILSCDEGNVASVPAGLIDYNVTKSSAMSPALSRTCALLNDLIFNDCVKAKLLYDN
jgi:DNA (cytosine-5)-methyltransferase 1